MFLVTRVHRLPIRLYFIQPAQRDVDMFKVARNICESDE